MQLRPYQNDSVSAASEALFKRNLHSVIIQAPTGTGKTAVQSAIKNKIHERIKSKQLKQDFSGWLIVPRIELIGQASKHFQKYRLPHGIIAPGHRELSCYNFHIVSKDTLPRRINQIKRPPDLIMIDEAHLAIDFQIWLANLYPNAKIIGYTATPERLDGRGLSTETGGIYDDLIMSPSIPWFTAAGFLVDIDYYAPPPDTEIDKIKKVGIDLDKKEFELYLKKRKIYGEAVGHYEKHGKGKPGIIFNHSVQAAYEQAEEFTRFGFKAYCIEGKMPKGRRRALIDALSTGEIDILTNCEIATYGIDIPRVEYGAFLRYTMSKALYFQMVGRLLRPFEIKEGDNVKYRKEVAIAFDHVGLATEHEDPSYPGVLPHYVENLTWDFHGREKRKRKKADEKVRSLRYCPECGLYSKTPGKCSRCGAIFSVKEKTKIEKVDVELQKVAKPAKFNELPEEEKREHIDAVNSAINEYNDAVDAGDTIAAGPVGKLLDICKQRGYKPLWVYNRLVPDKQLTVNVTLLHEIARQMDYNPKWVFFAKKQVSRG